MSYNTDDAQIHYLSYNKVCCTVMTHSLTLITGLRGFHFYQRIWKPKIGQPIILRRQPENRYDKNAIVGLVVKEESDNRSTEVGHLPKEIAKQVSDALKQGQVQITATLLVETGRGAKGAKEWNYQ